METWFLIILTACLAFLLRTFIYSLKPNPNPKLPPGPKGGVPIFTTLKWVRIITSAKLEPTLRFLFSKFGPIVTIPLGSRPFIYVSSHALAYQALVQKGAMFADRPDPLATAKVMTSFQYNINSSPYGPFWRALRRNLTSKMLHPSRLKEYSQARQWALEMLTTRLNFVNAPVKVRDHFQFVMFSLLVFMCFGKTLEESKIREIEDLEKEVLISFIKSFMLSFFPKLTRTFLWKRWDALSSLNKKQQDILLPLIRSRDKCSSVTSYVDTLLSLEIQGRELSDEELVSSVSEFLAAGTDTSSTTFEWIMANLVKFPEIQAKLFDEIRSIVGSDAEEIREEDLLKMPYLKAIVLEGLRRHPPGHFLLSHTVTQDVELGGYVVPKNAIVNFAVAEMGRDPSVWEDPMEFRPERFMWSDGPVDFDITCNREIKMMPFGAGRRICPGSGLAINHLEYFVANSVWKFEWLASEDHQVDLSEVLEFTTVMKHPLHARISSRRSPL